LRAFCWVDWRSRQGREKAMEVLMAAKKNSLVGNINKRKAAGTSRPKSKSTVSDKAYSDMKKNWGRKK
jgi:hypothetical protein